MLKKELEVEFKRLSEEFKELKSLTEKLFKKYEHLEHKYEKCLKVKANPGFKCIFCEQECENIKDLQKHKEEKHATLTEFKCGECERCFKSEKKLEDHKKTHEKFECDECDKIFKYERLLERHVNAVHSDSDYIIFCHYYNNDKECPFGDYCLYEHKESEKCKFRKGCERIMCMYRHDDKDNENVEDDESGSDSDCSEVDMNKIKPVLEKVRQAVERCDDIMEQCSFKCKKCDFEAKDRNGLIMHKIAKHPTKAN